MAIASSLGEKVAEGEHEGAAREDGRAAREQRGAVGEPVDETVVSAGAKRRRLSQRGVTGWPGFGESMYILYTPKT